MSIIPNKRKAVKQGHLFYNRQIKKSTDTSLQMGAGIHSLRVSAARKPLLGTPTGPACHRGHAKTRAQGSDPRPFQSKASRLWGITALPRSGSALTANPGSLPE